MVRTTIYMPRRTKVVALHMPRSVPNMGSRSGDHIFNDGPTYLWNVVFTVVDLGNHKYTVLADTSEEAVGNAFKFINAEYANPVVIRISVSRERSLVVRANSITPN